jgi:hypothetical protein
MPQLFVSQWCTLLWRRVWVGGGSGRHFESATVHAQCCYSLSLFDKLYDVVDSELEEAAAAILNQRQSTLNAATIFSHWCTLLWRRLWVTGGSGRHFELALDHIQCVTIFFISVWRTLLCCRFWVGGGSGRHLESAVVHAQCCFYLSLFDAL